MGKLFLKFGCSSGHGTGERRYLTTPALLLKGLIVATAFATQLAHAATCHQTSCTIMGTNGNDLLNGTHGDDVICGLGGDDVIKGKGGNDLICGGTGNDIIAGDSGTNTLIGGIGDDILKSKSASDVLYGNQGDNIIYDQSGAATIVPGSENEVVYYKNSQIAHKTRVSKNTDGSTQGNSSLNANGQNSSAKNKSILRGASETLPARFTTKNNTIYSPDGSVFKIKGVNVFPWSLGETNVSGIVDCWQFNTVRLHSWILPRMTTKWKDHLVYVDEPLLFDENEDRFRLYDIAPLIDTYTSKGIVVIVDIHDHIGSYFVGEDLSQYVTFLEHFVNRYKDNPYVWVDLHNEPGNWEGLDGDFTNWRTEMPLLMDTVRSISEDMIMMVSGTAWGQDTGPTWRDGKVLAEQSALLANSDVIQGYSNLITTFHMYDQWNFSYDRVKNFVDELLIASDAPIYIGEYGSSNNSSTLRATEHLHTLLQEPGYDKIGRSVWHWSALDANDLTSTGDGSGYLVDSCESPTNLSPLGELVWADNHTN